jgi:hypothetical protein
MTFQPQPTVKGVYRVKVYNSGNDDYWKYMWDGKAWTAKSAQAPWIKLTTLEQSSDRFKVIHPCSLFFFRAIHRVFPTVEHRACRRQNRLLYYLPSRR